MASDSKGTRLTVAVGKNGRFTLSLSAGTYQLTGYGPLTGSDKYGCGRDSLGAHTASIARSLSKDHYLGEPEDTS